VRERVDQALTRLVNWVVTRARALLSRTLGGPGADATPQQRLDLALPEAQRAVDRFAGRAVGAVLLRPLLAAIRLRYQLTALEPFEREGKWWVRGSINPTVEGATSALAPSGPAGGAVAPGRTYAAPDELKDVATPNLDLLQKQETNAPQRYVDDWKAKFAGKAHKLFKTIRDYVEPRAARKLGRRAEAPGVAQLQANLGRTDFGRNTRTVLMYKQAPDGSWVPRSEPLDRGPRRIPDLFGWGVLVGDSKREPYRAFSDQLRDFLLITKGHPDYPCHFIDEPGKWIPPAVEGFHLLTMAPNDELPEGGRVAADLEGAVYGTGGEIWPVLD
jgi:hypothetical protein